MEWFSDAWAWLGSEIAAFGIRWLVILLIVLGFGGFIGRRYRRMRRDIRRLTGESERLTGETAGLKDSSRGVTIRAAPGAIVNHGYNVILGNRIVLDGRAEISTRETVRVQHLAATITAGPSTISAGLRVVKPEDQS